MVLPPPLARIPTNIPRRSHHTGEMTRPGSASCVKGNFTVGQFPVMTCSGHSRALFFKIGEFFDHDERVRAATLTELSSEEVRQFQFPLLSCAACVTHGD